MSVKVSSEKKMRKEEIDDNQSLKKSSESNYDDSDDDNIVVLPYDVVRMIFKDLVAKDLSNCAMVCRLWQDVAVSELANRGPITKFVVWDEVFKKCFSSKHFPQDLTNRPMLGLLFNGTNQVPPDCMGKHLPKRCVTLVIGTYGVVMNNQEYERCPKNAVYGFLPDDPDVDLEFIMGNKNNVIHFNKNLEILNNGEQPHRLSVIEPMFQEAVGRMKGVKGMLLITTEQFRHEDKLSGLNVIKQSIPMLWGGVSKKLMVCKRDSGVSKTDQMLWMAVLIGGQNVRCWSVVLEIENHSKNHMKDRLTAMRRKVKLLKRSIGLMFACVGRGEAMHNEKHVEATIFREVFPEIPLIGGFGNGEYGFSFDEYAGE